MPTFSLMEQIVVVHILKMPIPYSMYSTAYGYEFLGGA